MNPTKWSNKSSVVVRKTNLVSFGRSNNCGAFNKKVNGSIHDEENFLRYWIAFLF